MGGGRVVNARNRTRRLSGAAVFIILLLVAGPQLSPGHLNLAPLVRPPDLSQTSPAPLHPRPLPRTWRGAVRAGIPTPRKLKHVDPVYPEGARQEQIEGVVLVEILIDEGGAVEDARVLRSVGLLDQAAIDAVKQWRFSPSLLEDEPVRVILPVRVQFALPK